MKREGPRSEFARYAYGYSDQKPGWTYWLILAGMIAYCLYSMVSISWAMGAPTCGRKSEFMDYVESMGAKVVEKFENGSVRYAEPNMATWMTVTFIGDGVCVIWHGYISKDGKYVVIGS